MQSKTPRVTRPGWPVLTTGRVVSRPQLDVTAREGNFIETLLSPSELQMQWGQNGNPKSQKLTRPWQPSLSVIRYVVPLMSHPLTGHCFTPTTSLTHHWPHHCLVSPCRELFEMQNAEPRKVRQLFCFCFFSPHDFICRFCWSLLFNSAVLFHQICDGPPLSAYDQEIVCPFFFILSVMLCKWNTHMVSVLFLFR